MKTHILYSHGNAADIGQMFEFLVLLRDYLNVNVLHYEYVGYGLAKDQGSPSEKDTYESVEAAFNFLVNQQGVSPSDIIIFGTSVGSGPSCHIASKHPNLRGLILECPFASIMRVVSNSVLARPLDMFQNISKIDQVKFPVLIIHGTLDDVVPFEHGKALWEKVPDQYKYEPQWVQNGNHHNLIELLTVRGYITVLNTFLTHCQKFVEGRERSKTDDGMLTSSGATRASRSWFPFSSVSQNNL